MLKGYKGATLNKPTYSGLTQSYNSTSDETYFSYTLSNPNSTYVLYEVGGTAGGQSLS